VTQKSTNCLEFSGAIFNIIFFWVLSVSIYTPPPFFLIRTVGTPSEDTWPGVTKLPEFKPNFPCWKAQPWEKILPEADALALDLLSVSACPLD